MYTASIILYRSHVRSEIMHFSRVRVVNFERRHRQDTKPRINRHAKRPAPPPPRPMENCFFFLFFPSMILCGVPPYSAVDVLTNKIILNLQIERRYPSTSTNSRRLLLVRVTRADSKRMCSPRIIEAYTCKKVLTAYLRCTKIV